MLKLSKLKKLQKFMSCVTWLNSSPLPPPLPLRPQHLHSLLQSQWWKNFRMGLHDSHVPLVVCAVRANKVQTPPPPPKKKNKIKNKKMKISHRWQNDNAFAYRFKFREKRLVKKAYAEIEMKCSSSSFTCTFLTMTIMTDKSPRQITPVAYKKR